MNADPRGGLGGPRTDEAAGPGRWLASLGRHAWYLAIAAAAALGMIIIGGVGILVQGNGTPSPQLASDCGLINCGASLPSPNISTQSHISKVHTSVSHAPSAPKQPAPSPTPSQTATPAPAAAANVTVTVTANRDRHDPDRFHDQLTLVNQGGSPVSGWTVQLTLPGDGIDSVESVSGWDGVPFDHWRYSEDTLTISADTDSETLGPGAPLNVSIHGRGRTISPTGCTFNGAACPALSWQQVPPSGQQDPPSGQHDQRSQDPPSGQPDQPSGQQDQRSWADRQSQGRR
jgi:hypothetical protein